jgi:hypothetical protein
MSVQLSGLISGPSASVRVLCKAVLPALLLALLCLPGQALAVSADCPALFDLYRTCHGQGLQADSSKACLEGNVEAMARALTKVSRKNPQGAQVLVELVCGTGCDDAVSLREPATRQEFSEAFCN